MKYIKLYEDKTGTEMEILLDAIQEVLDEYDIKKFGFSNESSNNKFCFVMGKSQIRIFIDFIN